MLTYTSTKWVNGSGSPLNATNLNNIETGIDALVGAVNTHEGTLEGHGKDIAALKQVDGTHATDIASNRENIGKLTNNLAKTDETVAEHETRIDVLETIVGPETETSGLTKRVKDLETNSATKVALKSATDRIGTIESTYATDNDLLAVDTRLAADIDEVDERLKARIADAEQDIITLQNSSGGGGASTWEDLAGKPSTFNPTSHANGDSSVYGAATTSLYGHVKISNGDVANTASANGLAAGMDHSHSDYATKTEATTTTAGLLSASDKTKLDGIATGADKTTIVNNLTSDSVTAALSAAQGKALKTAIDSLTGDLGELGGGDMLKASYDTDNNGKVDNADNATKFDGHSISEFSMDGHKHEIASVTGLQTALNGKSDSEHVHDYADKAFKAVEVGRTTITADNHQDTLVIAAGSNITLTPDATNHKITIAAKDTTYTFTNKAATLAWGSTATIATVGGTNITVTMPANPNSDTKVTSVDNHYTPSANSASALGVDASGATSTASWNSTNLVTGVNLQRDAKGHVTGVTVDSIKMPANPNTDTHHTAKNIVAAGSTATANATATNGNVYLNLIENGAVRSTHKITGSGATTVTADGNGNITISSTDNNTTYTFNGAVSTIKDSNLTASRALISNSSGKVAVSAVTSTELGYLDGVTSSVQTQLNNLLDMLTWKEF